MPETQSFWGYPWWAYVLAATSLLMAGIVHEMRMEARRERLRAQYEPIGRGGWKSRLSTESLDVGFGGIEWGTNMANCRDMVLANDFRDGHRGYVRKGDGATFGRSKLLMPLVYVFYQSRFSGVMGFTDGRENWLELRSALVERYGERNNPNESDYEWVWETEHVLMTLKYDTRTTRGSLNVFHRPIARQIIGEQATD